MTDDLVTSDASALIDRYADAAMKHGRASQEGRHEQANAFYEVIITTYQELRRADADEQRRLLKLLIHPNAFVRAWAGAHALEFAPDAGEATLTKLAVEDRGLAGLAAKTSLDEWRAGRLTFL